MEKNIKESLGKSYAVLEPFSLKYRNDFKRFLFSLNLLSLKGVKNKKILDIGSGIGIMAVALKNLGAEISGVDKYIFPDEPENFYTIFDFEKLKHIWEENGIKIIKADMAREKLPFGGGYFDIVICDATIEHFINSPKNLFKEAHRVLKNGGLFLATTPNLANLLKRIRFLFGRSPDWDIKDFFSSRDNFRGHRREYTLKELVLMLEWSSFDVIFKGGKVVFFNPKRLLNFKKIPSQLCSLISYVLPDCRDMIYVLGRKNQPCAP